MAEQFFRDGERRFGYGDYSYGGRWRSVPKKRAEHYDLKPGDRFLDIRCGNAASRDLVLRT